MARIERLYERSTLKTDTCRDLLDPAADNPIHDSNILAEAAASRLESRRNSNFLINLALRVKLSIAVEATETGDMVKRDDPIA
jgi:hypothetical protein